MKFDQLFPTDKTSDKDGNFECGRKNGMENKEFRLPSDVTCDRCTLQWSWTTEERTIYSCSDIMINGQTSDCLTSG